MTEEECPIDRGLFIVPGKKKFHSRFERLENIETKLIMPVENFYTKLNLLA